MNGRYPPIRSIRPEIPDLVAGVVERCLENDPHDRFANGADLARALLRALDDRDDRVRLQTTVALKRGSRSGQTGQEIRFTTTSDGVAIGYTTRHHGG